MKVFKIVPLKAKYYGCAIVAADNKNVAINIWQSNDELNKDLWYDGVCVCLECSELKADLDTPKVILNTIVDMNW